MSVRHSGGTARLARVAEQLRQELSELMLTSMKDPRVRLASVIAVRPSPDLRSAHVLVSVVGTDSERAACIEGLRHAEGYLRGVLGERLENLRSVPHLHFELDRSVEYSVHINDVLRELVDPAAAGRVDLGAGEPGS